MKNIKRGIILGIVILIVLLSFVSAASITYKESEIYAAKEANLPALGAKDRYFADYITGAKLCIELSNGQYPILESFGFPKESSCLSSWKFYAWDFDNSKWMDKGCHFYKGQQGKDSPDITTLTCRTKNTGEKTPFEIPVSDIVIVNDLYTNKNDNVPDYDFTNIRFSADVLTGKKLCELKGYDDLINFDPHVYDTPGYRVKINYFWDGNKWKNHSVNTSYSYSWIATAPGLTTSQIKCWNCIPKTCADYAGKCGNNLNDGCTGVIDCSNNCPAGQNCQNEQCVPIVVAHNCINENQVIMRLNSPKDSLGALWNQETAEYSICYNEFFNEYIDANPHECAANNENLVLLLNDISDATASTSEDSSFTEKVCFGDLMCRVVEDSLNEGIAGDYNFDGNADDKSGNSNNGVVQGAVLTEGKYGQAYQFDGINDNITISNLIGDDFTISAWIKTNTDSQTGTECFYGNGIFWSDIDFIKDDFILSALNNKLCFLTGNTESAPNRDDSIEGETEINDNQWHFIAITRIKGGEKAIYVDGAKESTGITSSKTLNANSKILIGASTSSTNRGFFNGIIDDIKIWNRALTEQEIADEYADIKADCESDEKLILRLSDLTNARLSNATYENFPVKICCKKKPALLGEAFWTNMMNEPITNAEKYDSVKLFVEREGLENVLINYIIKEKNSLLGIDWLWPDSKIAQFSGKGLSVWKANVSGTFYFDAVFSDTGQMISSSDIFISNTPDNSIPRIEIANPAFESDYTMSVAVNLTRAIRFEALIQDEDDDINLTWSFGDDNLTSFSNCLSTIDCNTTHVYKKTGTKVISIIAKEMTRGNKVKNCSRAYIYRNDLSLFAIISGLGCGNEVQEAGLYTIDGTLSYVADCGFNIADCRAKVSAPSECYEIKDNEGGNSVYCYKKAKSYDSSADSCNSAFIFTWIFDNAEDALHKDCKPFQKLFVERGEHDIKLRVKYSYQNE